MLCSKLKSRFGVDAELDPPALPTVRRSAAPSASRAAIKQTGGSGQFGDVHIIFEPRRAGGYDLRGERVRRLRPKNYFPPWKRVCAGRFHGVLAGYPVVFLKATLVDGSYHPVDSSEIAFKLAANLAFKAALPEAKPVLMEPV